MNKTTFDKIYENYLAEIAGLDFESIKNQLGIEVDNDEAVINFFGSSYRVSPKGIKDPSGKMLGGCSPDIDLTYELSMKFDALPKVPILMLFNDEDDEFPAQTSMLFEKRAEKYLDMECLAIIGWSLYELLIEITENSKGTLI